MARRLNFTNRKKITKSDVVVRVHKHGSGLIFDAELSQLGNYGLDPQARVHIEAYRSASTSWHRWDFGRVGLLSVPSAEDRVLDKFGGTDGLRFRVKVSGDGEQAGRLLAEADGVEPILPDEPEGNRKALIGCELGDIGSEVWRVEFNDGSAPFIVVNDRFADLGWKEMLRDPKIRALIVPPAMRDILTRILVVDRNTGDENDPTDWRTRWIQFAESLPGVEPDPEVVERDEHNKAEVQDWINAAVNAFGKQSGLLERFLELRRQEVGQ